MSEVTGTERETRQLAMVMHLSQLVGWFVPIAGWAVPIVIWQVKKNDLPGVDEHGKVIVNWLITQFLASTVLGILFVVLMFLVVTIPLVIPVIIAISALWLAGLIFTVVGAIKANDGEVWPYPGSIPFFN